MYMYRRNCFCHICQLITVLISSLHGYSAILAAKLMIKLDLT